MMYLSTLHSTFSPVEIQFEPKKGVYYYINYYLLLVSIQYIQFIYIQTELGYYPICIQFYKLMFKYYSRLVDIESNCDSKFNLLKKYHKTHLQSKAFHMLNIVSISVIKITKRNKFRRYLTSY
jgi:hypothetical protein